MKRMTKRLLRPVLCLALILALVGGLTASAVGTPWVEAPTGWVNWGHVDYQTVTQGGKTYVLNWGVRGERAVFLTEYALDYYESPDWAAGLMETLDGGTGVGDVLDSPLYAALRSFLQGKHTHQTTYGETRDLYRYTDCMVSDGAHISSFYSGVQLNGTWDSGATWNREHTWPNSKGFDEQDNDIMMLRPTAVSENSSRGNLAYGESTGFYHPNAETDGTFDLRGDCARIMLYCYVRWSNQAYMWGASGVMESLEVLLNWMEADPVDTWELGRNDAVQSITGVRNCFVDYPELAWALFGREVPAAVYPSPSSAPQLVLTAESSDETKGAVEVRGWSVVCTPAEGCMVSGYVTVVSALEPGLPPEPDLRWQGDRLLWYPTAGETGLHIQVCFAEKEPPAVFRFEDVSDPGKYYYEPVYWAYFHLPQITSGTDAEHFSPGKSCTRAQIVTFLWHALGDPEPETGENPFLDVKETDYFYKAVLWAAETGVTGGTDADHFSPKKTCTRAEAMTFLWKAAEAPLPTLMESPFQDVPADKYYCVPVLWAYENGVTGGTDATHFSPKQTCTRGQIVTFLFAAFGAE